MRHEILSVLTVLMLSLSVQAQEKETPLKLILHSDFLNLPLTETSDMQYTSGLGFEYRLSKGLQVEIGFEGLNFLETNGSIYASDSYLSIGTGFNVCKKCGDSGIQWRYMSSFSSLFSLDNSSFELGYRNGMFKNSFIEGGFKYFKSKKVDYLNDANFGFYFKLGLSIGIRN